MYYPADKNIFGYSLGNYSNIIDMPFPTNKMNDIYNL